MIFKVINRTVENQEVTAQVDADLDDNAIHQKYYDWYIYENYKNVLCLISINKESGKNFV